MKRDAEGRIDEDNIFESKTTRDHHLCLQPSKRLETYLPYEGGFQE